MSRSIFRCCCSAGTEARGGRAAPRKLTDFPRTPIKTYYLQRDGEPQYHLVDEPFVMVLGDNLLRDGVLSYNTGGWSALARVQRYQTLQDPLAPVVAPYRRQPQLNLNAQQTLNSANVTLASEYVDFRHDTLVSGERLVVYPSASYPLVSDPGYYLTPKLGVHYTQYRMGANNTASLPDASRTLPIFSLDSGMVYERDLMSFLGGNYVQTMEPRLYYVYIPYKDQRMMPIFDTAQAPLTFGQLFTENRFFGGDRVGDANMATLALTSRVIDDEGGDSHRHDSPRFASAARRLARANRRRQRPGTYAHPPRPPRCRAPGRRW